LNTTDIEDRPVTRYLPARHNTGSKNAGIHTCSFIVLKYLLLEFKFKA